MTRIEVVMTALTKRNTTMQTTPITDAPRRVDPKDPRTSNPHKDKRKRIIGETLRKAPSTKQQKRSKIVDQPQQKKKGNHASGKGDQTNSRGRVALKDKMMPKSRSLLPGRTRIVVMTLIIKAMMLMRNIQSQTAIVEVSLGDNI
uniref:Uncharacterized protein n=1 Tax=Cannabis sativa TaxID=3483 RepID=A0A803NLD1_CANSA